MARNQIPRFGTCCQMLMLIALCIVQVIQSQDLKPETRLKNWLQISSKNWPVVDPDDPKETSKPFFLYHREHSGEFGLKKWILPKWDNLQRKPVLSFKYWASNSLGRFRTLDGTNKPSVELDEPSEKWATKRLEPKTEIEWNNFIMQPSDIYTIALKDVQLKYTEKIVPSTIDPIHGHKGNEILNGNEKISNQGSIILTGNSQISLEPKNDIKLNDLYSKAIMTFDIKSIPGGVTKNVQLFQDLPNNRDKCKVANGDGLKIECEIITNSKTVKTISFNKTGDKIDAFLISNFKGVLVEQDKLVANNFKTAPSSENGAIYTIKQSKNSFINLIDNQDDNQDRCYVILSPQTQQIEVYLTLENQKQGILLTKFNGKTKFCLNDFVALRFLTKFQLTLVFGNVGAAFDAVLMRTSNPAEFKPKKPKSTMNQLALTELTKGWYYYNPLLDYSIQGDENSSVKLWLCDIVANCFLYTRTFDAGKTGYSVPDEFKSILANSPFVRIASEGKPTVDKFSFGYKDSQTKILNEVKKEFDQLIEQQGAVIIGNRIEITKTVSNNTEMTLKVPVTKVDQRFQKLIISITYPKDSITINSLEFKFEGEADSQNLINIFKIKKSLNEKIEFSTDEFLHVEPFEISGSIHGNYEILLHPKSDGYVMVKLTLEDSVKSPLTDFQKNILPASLPKPEPSKLSRLNEANPVAIISSGLVRAGFDRKVPSYEINVTLTSENDQTLTDADVSVKMIVISENVYVEDYYNFDYDAIDDINDVLTLKETKNPNFQVPLKGGVFELMYLIRLVNVTKKEVSINVVTFKMDPPKAAPLTKPVVATFDPRFDSWFCPKSFEATCQLTSSYKEQTIDFNAQDISNLFSTKFAISKNYANVTSQPRYLPYQGDTQLDGQPSPSYLQIVKPPGNLEKDFCVNFSYLSKTVPLQVLANEPSRNSLSIEFPQSQSEQVRNRICASLFTNYVKTVHALYFRMMISDINYNLDDDYYLNILTVEFNDNKNTVEKGIHQGDSLIDKFFDGSKDSFTIVDQTIEFKIADLQGVKKVPNKSNFYLHSKWFKAPNKAKTQIHLTLKPEGLDINKDFLTAASLIFASPSQPKLAEKKLSEINITAVNVFDIEQSDYYQLIIRIQLDTGKIKDQDNEFALKLRNLTINDPCLVETTAQPRNCNHGKCVEDYENFNSTCECKVGYNPNDSCAAEDICLRYHDGTNKPTNEDYCMGIGAKGCDSKLGTYECKCDDKLQWNSILQNCIEKELKQCEDETRILQKTGTTFDCVCIDGYVEEEKNKPCVKYNPCNTNHRKYMKESSVETCSDKYNLQCAQKPTTNNPYGFECNCKEGFYSPYGSKENKDSTCLSNDCKVCDQSCRRKEGTKPEENQFKCTCKSPLYEFKNGKCEPKDDKLDTSKCTPGKVEDGIPAPFVGGTTCACPDDFTYDSNNKTCVIASNAINKYGCHKLEIRDRKIACACEKEDGLVLDTSTGRCLPECTKEKAEECSKFQAVCSYDALAKKAKCNCKDGDVAFASNSSVPDGWICLPKCSLLNLPNWYDRNCLGQYQYCDPSKLEFDDLYKNEVFVSGSSKINSTSDHCQCEIGFIKVQTTCKISPVPIRFIKEMLFDVSASAKEDVERKVFVERVQYAFASLVRTIFHTNPVDTKCQQKDNDKVSCDTGFGTALKKEAIEESFKQNCILQSGTKKCVYLTEAMPKNVKRAKRNANTEEMVAFNPPSKPSSFLIRDLENKIDVHDFDYCTKKDRCRAHYENSKCNSKLIGEQNVFECTCDPDIFEIQSRVPSVFNGVSLDRHSCTLKNLCVDKQNYGCTDEAAHCNLMVDYDESADKYTPKSFCSCPDSKLALSSRDRFCKNSCDGYCVNGDCAHDVFDANRIVCHCHDGFNGTKCEEKLNYYTEVTGVSSGYKTATIILSVFFGLGLLVLVVFAVRRYTSFDFVYYISRVFRREQNSMQQHSQQQQQHSHQPPPRQNVAQNIPLERRTPANQ